MSKYQLCGEPEDGVLDKETGGCIPADPENEHWVQYQEWLAEGNTPDPFPPTGSTTDPEPEYTP